MPAGPSAGSSAVWAILLAAGGSTRFGSGNKLLAEISGTPLVRHAAGQLTASRAGGVVAVTGFEGERVERALDGLDMRRVHNADFAEGIAASIRCGITALPENAGGALICLADMPGTTPALVDTLIAAFEEAGADRIVYPVRGDGGQANPVLWPRRFFGELARLTGDTGAKALIRAHADATVSVEIGDESRFADIDTADDLTAWRDGVKTPGA